MCGSMVDIQSVAAEIRRGIKEEEERKKPQGKNIMSASAMQGGHKEAQEDCRTYTVEETATVAVHLT